MGLSRIWAKKYGIFEVRNGYVTCTEQARSQGVQWVQLHPPIEEKGTIAPPKTLCKGANFKSQISCGLDILQSQYFIKI